LKELALKKTPFQFFKFEDPKKKGILNSPLFGLRGPTTTGVKRGFRRTKGAEIYWGQNFL